MKLMQKGISTLLVVLLLIGIVPLNANASDASLSAAGTVLQQTDTRWKSYNFGGKTLGESACGMFSSLNAVQFLTGHRFTIGEIHTWADYAGKKCYVYGQGSVHTAPQILADKFGEQYNYRCTEYYPFASHVATSNSYPANKTAWNTLWNKLTSELSMGRVCVTLVPGHFIAIVDYDPETNKVLVFDSAASYSRGTTTYGDWKSSNELYYGSSEGKSKLKIRACFSFLETINPVETITANIFDITSTNATIDIKINNRASRFVSAYGYAIGKASFGLTPKTITCSSYEASLHYTLDITSTYKNLAAGQMYYYYAYVYIGGKEYKTDLKFFRTSGIPFFSVDSTSIKNITSNNATINATFKNTLLSSLSYFGFYIGTDKKDMEKIFGTHILGMSKNHVNLDIASCYYTALKPNTEYYYCVFVAVNGEEYLGNVKSFVTAAPSTDDYTIKYVVTGGNGAPKTQIKKHGLDIYLSNGIPTKEYHDFIGWALNANSDEPDYLPGDRFTEDCDTILYALWEKQSTDSGYVDGGDVDFNNAGGLKKGDINSDKFIDMSDVVVAQKIIARLADFTDFGTNSKTCADVNSDGYLTMEDVTEMQKYIAKLITSF